MEMQRQRLALCGFFTQARLPHPHSPAGLQLTLFENGAGLRTGATGLSCLTRTQVVAGIFLPVCRAYCKDETGTGHVFTEDQAVVSSTGLPVL